ncbi:hypothetical protein ABZ897_22150 [Nonomuraea sp. NPDC046802]|uniref:hypothetical protein n=1 Tax=Nonomuraea sp. NPDC046802 TaxID=3154919 RepID=UPI0033F6438E
MRYTVDAVANELGVSVRDMTVVADVELGGPPLYDPDGYVSENGRRRLIDHFLGGVDPPQ